MAVVQGNLIRNLVARRPVGTDPGDGNGIGIGVEADTAVTGNVIENAPVAGISLGWGQYLRDVSVTGNVVRGAGVGIQVSVTPGAGSAVIASTLALSLVVLAQAIVFAIAGSARAEPGHVFPLRARPGGVCQVDQSRSKSCPRTAPPGNCAVCRLV